MHGVPDNATTSRPADLTRLVKGRLDAAAPCRGPTPAPSQSIQAVSHIGRPGSNKRPVLVEFFTHTAKHEAFKLSPQLRRARCRPSRRSCGESLKASCLAVWVERTPLIPDELTPKQLEAQKGLAADFSALKLKDFSPFCRRAQLLYRDQGINRTCKRWEAIRVSAPSSPPKGISWAPSPFSWA